MNRSSPDADGTHPNKEQETYHGWRTKIKVLRYFVSSVALKVRRLHTTIGGAKNKGPPIDTFGYAYDRHSKQKTYPRADKVFDHFVTAVFFIHGSFLGRAGRCHQQHVCALGGLKLVTLKGFEGINRTLIKLLGLLEKGFVMDVSYFCPIVFDDFTG